MPRPCDRLGHVRSSTARQSRALPASRRDPTLPPKPCRDCRPLSAVHVARSLGARRVDVRTRGVGECRERAPTGHHQPRSVGIGDRVHSEWPIASPRNTQYRSRCEMDHMALPPSNHLDRHLEQWMYETTDVGHCASPFRHSNGGANLSLTVRSDNWFSRSDAHTPKASTRLALASTQVICAPCAALRERPTSGHVAVSDVSRTCQYELHRPSWQ